MDAIAAAIRGIVAPLDEVPVFELIEQEHESTREHAEQLAQLPLTESRIRSQHAQQAGEMGLQVEGDEALFENICGVRSHLREQERNAHIRDRTGHSGILNFDHD
jgi:hypothetical protein